MRSSGFALLSVLMASAIIGLTTLSLLSALNIGVKQIKQSEESLSVNNARPIIEKLMTVENCSCHFDPSQNTSTRDSLSINTLASDEIDLGVLRTGCDFSSDNNIVLKPGKEIGGGLTVSEVKVSDIQANSGSTEHYSGNLIVTYDTDSQLAYKPTSIPLHFIINPTEGTSSTRPITSCWSDSYGLSPSLCYAFGDSSNRQYTLIGCGGTSEPTSFGRTAFGFQAGSPRNSNSFNTYFGYKAGSYHAGEKSTFIGYMAGHFSQDNTGNIFVGFQSGKNVTTGGNLTFIGSDSGSNTTIGDDNVFLGYKSGEANVKGEQNVYIGSQAGRSGMNAMDNVFIGYQSGMSNVNGSQNVFLGSQAGLSSEGGSHSVVIGFKAGTDNTEIQESVMIGTSAGASSQEGIHSIMIGFSAGYNNEGNENTFIGYNSGLNSASGNQNTFVGFNSGVHTQAGGNTFVGAITGLRNATGSKNVFIGHGAGGPTSTGSYNTMVGNIAGGRNISGNYNVFIGEEAANDDRYARLNNQFAVGNRFNKTWLTGDITSSGNLYVNGQQVIVNSSRFLKKNIQPFTDVNKALKDILDTPLFTYQYKNKMNHPEKIRMGLLAEDLPEHLRIQQKELPHPDWPSIYGTFWAGIKSLYAMIEHFQKKILSEISFLTSRIHKFQSEQTKFVKDFIEAKKEFLEIKSKLKQVNSEIKQIEKEILVTKRNHLNKWNHWVESRSPFPEIKKSALYQNTSHSSQ